MCAHGTTFFSFIVFLLAQCHCNSATQLARRALSHRQTHTNTALLQPLTFAPSAIQQPIFGHHFSPP
ncbi:unnamed protein product [Caenorhabditis auriculariae]|uniref:Secreted protein n=1 Tax=Caenorhabditis auriculariae TaxID=2777116 RepID=A0A8S1H6M2_9PELO|nr:unnamed protein product [Caenorhabditis auriculariae]